MALFKDSGSSREPFLVAPAVVLWLIAAILIAHAIRILLPGDGPDLLVSDFAFIPARYSGSPEFSNDSPALLLIPFFSHIFLHANWAHAGVNSLWLLAFGPMVARRLGVAKFLIFFFCCGAAGVIAQLLAYWGSQDAVIGASGAISGLMAAAMRMVYGRPHGLSLAPIFSRQMLTFSLIWSAVNIATGVVGFGAGTELELVAWVVHLGGYFAGLLLIGLFDSASGWR